MGTWCLVISSGAIMAGGTSAFSVSPCMQPRETSQPSCTLRKPPPRVPHYPRAHSGNGPGARGARALKGAWRSRRTRSRSAVPGAAGAGAVPSRSARNGSTSTVAFVMITGFWRGRGRGGGGQVSEVLAAMMSPSVLRDPSHSPPSLSPLDPPFLFLPACSGEGRQKAGRAIRERAKGEAYRWRQR